MSAKSITLGLFGGLSGTASDNAGARRPSAGNRQAIILPRTSARPAGRSAAWAQADTKLYVGAALALAVAAMFLAYVFGINQSAAKGYEIAKQKNKLNTLIEENKKLTVRRAEIGSTLQIQDEAAADHLVQINSQEYLQANQLSQR
jgi:hypothetical protein